MGTSRKPAGGTATPAAPRPSVSNMKIANALVCASLCLLGAEAKPFSLESQYAGLLRSFGLNQRIARSAQSQYNSGRGQSASSGYGAASAPACRTEYKQECNTVNEQQCNTVNEQQCRTVQKNECNTVNEQVCNTVSEQQCNTVNEQKCETKYDTVNEQ